MNHAALSELLLARFGTRRDVYARQTGTNEFILVEEPLDTGVLRRHLSGGRCVGIYALDGDRAQWACVDLDAADGRAASALPALEALHRQCLRFGVELLWEFSGGKGYHGWLFSERTEARLLRTVMHGLVEETGEESFDGCTWPPEVFPKQDATTEESPYGNLVKLPLGKRADNGKSIYFIDPRTARPWDDQEAILAGGRVWAESELRELVEENGWELETTRPVEAPKSEGGFSRSGGTYRGDLPCFEFIHDRTSGAIIKENHRNLVLFAMSNQHKRRGSSQSVTEADILYLSAFRCQPPYEEKRALKTVASAYKSSNSTAGCEHIQNAELCPVLLHGVACPVWDKRENRNEKRAEALNSDEGRLTLLPMTVSKGDPVIYTATVQGRTLRLTVKELRLFTLFTERCMAELEMVPELPYLTYVDDQGKTKKRTEQSIWLDIVREALQGVEVQEAPEEASPLGIAWDAIREFITETKVSEERDKILSGAVVLEEDRYLFRGRDLRRWLKLNGIDVVSAHELWLLIKDRGGKNTLARTSKGHIRIFTLPVEAIRPQEIVEEETNVNAGFSNGLLI